MVTSHRPLFADRALGAQHRQPAGSLVLYDPIWGKVGLIELQRVDHTQTLVLFCLPEFSDNREIEKYEEKIRESLPAGN